jgi:hypothetical protein
MQVAFGTFVCGASNTFAVIQQMRSWGLRSIVFGPGTLVRTWGTRPVAIGFCYDTEPRRSHPQKINRKANCISRSVDSVAVERPKPVEPRGPPLGLLMLPLGVAIVG